MTIVNITQAKGDVLQLVERVEAGEEIILARGNEPVAKIVPLAQTSVEVRGYGRFAHLRDKIPSSLFLEPMSDDELDAWEGKYSFPGDNGQ